MVLNYIWIGFFLIALLVALYKTFFQHDMEVFTAMVDSTFEMAAVSFEIAIGLTGILCLWLGIMQIGEKVVPYSYYHEHLDHFLTDSFQMCQQIIQPEVL